MQGTQALDRTAARITQMEQQLAVRLSEPHFNVSEFSWLLANYTDNVASQALFPSEELFAKACGSADISVCKLSMYSHARHVSQSENLSNYLHSSTNPSIGMALFVACNQYSLSHTKSPQPFDTSVMANLPWYCSLEHDQAISSDQAQASTNELEQNESALDLENAYTSELADHIHALASNS